MNLAQSAPIVAGLHIPDEMITQIAEQVAERIAASFAHENGQPVWLDIEAAAAHLAMTVQAVRGLVKRDEIPVYRLPNGRLRFLRDELDRWAYSGSAS